ncbi:myb-like DNA-binding domain-containing protein [Sarocladium implicatum]|nr:myb-like DNA-binding domain-containing protein [Sarocladium implicatum]
MSQHQHHTSQMLMDPSQMGDHRLGQSGFGAPGSVVQPLYSTMPPTTQAPHAQHAPNRLKRPRLDELDISVTTMSPMDQQGLDSIHNTPIAGPYSQTSSAVQHHHHHLPDSGPPSKMARREDGGGGAPSVVGQAGMPQPAARPRGPKLKFTPEDDQLLIDLKEHKNLTWKQIADFFPGRTSGTLQVRYCTKLKAKTTLWTDETDHKLRTALQDYENEKWRIVANKVGTGFTPVACRERFEQLFVGAAPGSEVALTSPPVSGAVMEEAQMYTQQIR